MPASVVFVPPHHPKQESKKKELKVWDHKIFLVISILSNLVINMIATENLYDH
jgi:hypothetical protein